MECAPSRRQAMLGALVSTAAASMSNKSLAAPISPTLHGPYLDLATGEGNMLAMVRIQGNLDTSKTKYGWYTGRVMGAVPGAAVRDLLGIKGMGTGRLFPSADGQSYTIMRREIGFFFDLKTGEILDKWLNPYTNEMVDVVHVANKALQLKFDSIVSDERFYDDVQTSAPEPVPFILPWQIAGERLFVEQHGHFWVKNPLDPTVWVRESTGSEIQISDMMTFNVSLKDMQNNELTSLIYQGDWVHLRPWQPWMLMGTAPGHLINRAFTGGADSLDQLPPDIVQAVSDRNPAFLEAPDEISESEPSLVRYMRELQPAPHGQGE